jgi:hypothetical protein
MTKPHPEVLMNERDEYGTGAAQSPGSTGATSPQVQGRWSAGEQAGPATWTDRVPGSPGDGSEGTEPRQGQGVARKAAEQASRLAREAEQGVEQVVQQRKGQAAERIGAVASALHEAARALQQQQGPDGLARYADSAAEQLERASGYLREQDLRGILRQAEGFARRRPELFLAGSVLAGLALARFLKSSSRRSHAPSGEYGSPYYAEGSYAGESAYLQDEPIRREGAYQGTHPSSGPSTSGGMGEI